MKRKIINTIVILLYFLASLYLIDTSYKTKTINTIYNKNYKYDNKDEKRLIIPKINVDLPVVKADPNFDNLDDNLVYYKNFNINNKIIIFGHSGMGVGTFFNKLDELKKGDIAYLKFNSKTYLYEVLSFYNIDKKDTYILNEEENSNKLLLVTCTRGKKNKRYVVNLVQKN